MGNARTISLYCGSDPDFTVVHDEVIKSRHFDGCGLQRDQCTYRPCCDDAIRYNFNANTCNDTVLKDLVLYDPRI